MAGSQIERALKLLEYLAQDARGVALQQLADNLQIPKSAAHRMLTELVRLGYVRQCQRSGQYQLSTKLVAHGLQYLASSGADVVQLILDRLAENCCELVRLGVVEGAQQVWIAKSQGARSGLRYDPDMGRTAPLFYTASGHAWLASMDNHAALALLAAQAPTRSAELGPNAPRSEEQLLERLQQARQLGYAWVSESSSVGTAALACVVRAPQDQRVIGVLSIAGPSARLPLPRIQALSSSLLEAAQQLSQASLASELFN